MYSHKGQLAHGSSEFNLLHLTWRGILSVGNLTSPILQAEPYSPTRIKHKYFLVHSLDYKPSLPSDDKFHYGFTEIADRAETERSFLMLDKMNECIR